MDDTGFHILYTIVLLIIFIGIVAWAWSAKRKRSFRDAANLPFADDARDRRSGGAQASNKENNHE